MPRWPPLNELLPLQRSLHDNYSLVRSLSSVGSIYEERGLLDSAAYVWKEAYRIAITQGDPLSQGALATNLAVYYERKANPQQTRYWGKRAIEHYYATGDSAQAAAALGNLGNAERQLGHLSEGKKLLIQAVALSEQLGDSRILADNLKGLSLAYQDAGDVMKAVPLFWQYSALQDSLYKKKPGRRGCIPSTAD